jgi:hypothetical protein
MWPAAVMLPAGMFFALSCKQNRAVAVLRQVVSWHSTQPHPQRLTDNPADITEPFESTIAWVQLTQTVWQQDSLPLRP